MHIQQYTFDKQQGQKNSSCLLAEKNTIEYAYNIMDYYYYIIFQKFNEKTEKQFLKFVSYIPLITLTISEIQNTDA